MPTIGRVAYKPLNSTPLNINGDIHQDIFDDEDELNVTSDEEQNGTQQQNDVYRDEAPLDNSSVDPTIKANFEFYEIAHPSSRRLRRIRIALIGFATFLVALFMIQLHFHGSPIRDSSEQPVALHLPAAAAIKAPADLGSARSGNQTKFSTLGKHNSNESTIHKLDFKAYQLKNDVVSRPRYENYLTSVTSEKDTNYASSQETILDDLKPSSNPEHKNTNINSTTLVPWWTTNYRLAQKYVTVTNYIRAMKSFGSSVTLTTTTTTDFIHHALELCKRWDGPISVAVFCPGDEIFVAITLIKFMRSCLPAPLNACVCDKITWHLVFDAQHGPDPSEIQYPAKYLDSVGFPLFVRDEQCPKTPSSDAANSIKHLEELVRRARGLWPISYRQREQLTYPINVLRNTARLASTTEYIMASDIELYPSVNLVTKFMNFVTKPGVRQMLDANLRKYVFTLPIFEVEQGVIAPRNKQELVRLYEENKAVFFHKLVCDACQKFPNRLEWLKTDKFGSDNFRAPDDEIVVFKQTVRDKSRDSWEPIYIGTNNEPLYDDRLNWDGRRDKMGQMYEMCLQGYRLLILGNAFLVHAPGIKHIDRDDVRKRHKFIRQNNAIFDSTMLELKRTYADSLQIKIC